MPSHIKVDFGVNGSCHSPFYFLVRNYHNPNHCSRSINRFFHALECCSRGCQEGAAHPLRKLVGNNEV